MAHKENLWGRVNQLGPNPIVFSCPDTAVPTGHVLHFGVGSSQAVLQKLSREHIFIFLVVFLSIITPTG